MKAWTIFYTIGQESRVFRSFEKGETSREALDHLERREGKVNHALVYAGDHRNPDLDSDFSAVGCVVCPHFPDQKPSLHCEGCAYL